MASLLEMKAEVFGVEGEQHEVALGGGRVIRDVSRAPENDVEADAATALPRLTVGEVGGRPAIAVERRAVVADHEAAVRQLTGIGHRRARRRRQRPKLE